MSSLFETLKNELYSEIIQEEMTEGEYIEKDDKKDDKKLIKSIDSVKVESKNVLLGDSKTWFKSQDCLDEIKSVTTTKGEDIKVKVDTISNQLSASELLELKCKVMTHMSNYPNKMKVDSVVEDKRDKDRRNQLSFLQQVDLKSKVIDYMSKKQPIPLEIVRTLMGLNVKHPSESLPAPNTGKKRKRKIETSKMNPSESILTTVTSEKRNRRIETSKMNTENEDVQFLKQKIKQQCQFCDNIFINQQFLNYHIANFHNGRLLDEMFSE